MNNAPVASVDRFSNSDLAAFPVFLSTAALQSLNLNSNASHGAVKQSDRRDQIEARYQALGVTQARVFQLKCTPLAALGTTPQFESVGHTARAFACVGDSSVMTAQGSSTPTGYASTPIAAVRAIRPQSNEVNRASPHLALETIELPL